MNDLAPLINKIKQLETEIERLKRVEYPKGGGTGWQTYDGIAITGWNTSLSYTAQLEYTTVGNLVFCRLYVGGNSNATTAVIKLPFAAKSGLATAAFRGEITTASNGGTLLTAPGHWVITQGSNNLIAYTSMPAGTWTASGTKSINISFWYVKE